MMDKIVMVMGEVNLGIRPSPLPPIFQVFLVYHWVFIAMVMIEWNVGIRPANVIHITMLEYTLPTQDLLKKLFQGVWKDKINIKIILITLIQAYHPTLVQACHNILIKTCRLILIQS